MMLFVLIGWGLGVPLAIWWPRHADATTARARAYRALQRAAFCHLAGFLCWTLLLGVDPADGMLGLVVLVLAGIGALSLTPFAIGVLGLDFGNRALGVAGGALATLFPAGLTCYGILTLVGIYAGAGHWLLAIPALGTAVLCGVATWQVLEGYAIMRAPRVQNSKDVEE